MNSAIRAAGFSLMTMFVSCGVGARGLDTPIGIIAVASERPAQESIAWLSADRKVFHDYDGKRLWNDVQRR